jgi:dTDP-4-amino-4,6-dideoxygalactose transaminase
MHAVESHQTPALPCEVIWIRVRETAISALQGLGNWCELGLVPSHGPAGPALEQASPGVWLLPIPAGWRTCREKELAALRRTISTALLEILVGVRPKAIVVDDVSLCGLAGMIGARRCHAALFLRASGDLVDSLFDDRLLPILDPCLRACEAIIVGNERTAEALSGFIDEATQVTVDVNGGLDIINRMVNGGAATPWLRPHAQKLAVSRPHAVGNELSYVQEVLRSQWWGYGPAAHKLEEWFKDELGAGGALAVGSGTAALHLSLLALDLEPRDEVIVPALTFVSTAMSVTLAGGCPRFADVEPESLTLSVESVARCLSPRTRAVIVVHFAGVPVDMEPLEQMLTHYAIPIVEDAAHAIGASYRGRLVGAGSPFSCFSFAPTKAIASSSGGMLVYRNSALAPRLSRLSNVGLVVDTFQRNQRGDAPGNVVEEVGYRYRIDDVAAAITYAQIEQLSAKRQRREDLMARYREQLATIPTCRLLSAPPGASPTWYIAPLLVPRDVRDGLRRHLAMGNIDTSIHYPSLTEQPLYRGSQDATPVANDAGARLLTLPLHESIETADVDRICGMTADFLCKVR